MKFKEIEMMDIDKIARLPYFHLLEREPLEKDQYTPYWKITLRCSKKLPDGTWQFLDAI